MKKAIMVSLAVILVAVLLVPTINVPAVVSAVDEVVTFPDPNLEAAIRIDIAKPSGDIHQSDLDRLTYLHGDYDSIINLSGIENCTSLTDLRLELNQISDISVLSGLTNLWQLYLGDNQISDIGPLVSNTGLGHG